MPEIEETVLIGWARDADGAAQRFTGGDIYERVSVWCMDRLRRGIPTISTYFCTVRGLYFTSELAAVPMVSAPFKSLRRPDAMPVLEPDFVLMVYKGPEDG